MPKGMDEEVGGVDAGEEERVGLKGKLTNNNIWLTYCDFKHA